jgi:predicted DNA-binding transcriptional regulator AlpA
LSTEIQLLRKPDVARALSLSVRSLEEQMRQRKIPYRLIGGAVRFTQEDVRAFLDKCRVAPLDEVVGSRRQRQSVKTAQSK